MFEKGVSSSKLILYLGIMKNFLKALGLAFASLAVILAVIIGLVFYKFYYQIIVPTYLSIHSSQFNILLLGKGDKDHTSPDLTDTIILANINFKANKIKFISLPRDIWDEKEKTKINATYYWGKQKGRPFELTDQVIRRLTGLKIDYQVIIDFSTFKKIVDDLGGIWINSPDSFDDYHYPIAGREKTYPISSRYQHIHFDAGWQKMNGDRALIFVRSRHAKGQEGSDFARGRRQQLVVRGIINRLLSQKQKLLSRPQASYQMFEAWWNEINTNLQFKQLVKIGFILAKRSLEQRKLTQVKNYSFSSNSELLEPKKINVFGQEVWVLIPIQPQFKAKIEELVSTSGRSTL